LIYSVPRFGTTNEKLLAPKKIYACDVGVRNIFTGFRDLGSLFENYVYLQIRHKGLFYIYKDKTEIDFFTNDGTLIEAKFHNEKLSDKQQRLFDDFNAKQKFIVRTPEDVELISK
jgi:predicted AAA+ superfamily ATPase